MATEDRLVSWNRSRKRYLLAGSKCNQHSCQIGHLATGFQRNSRCAGWVLRFKLIQSVRTFGVWSICRSCSDHPLIICWSWASQTTSKAWKMACKPQCSALIELHHGMDFAKSKMERLKAAERRIFLRPKVVASLPRYQVQVAPENTMLHHFFRGSLLHNATTCHDLRGFEWSA